MIKTEAQYKATKKLIKQFNDSIVVLKANSRNEFTQIEINGIKSQVDDLSQELSVYEALKSGHINSIIVDNIRHISKVAIQGRIANGLTQKELGDKLGVAEQQIQRWESSDYETISVSTLLEILQELNINVPIGRISLSPIQFNLSNVDMQKIDIAQRKVASRGELLYI